MERGLELVAALQALGGRAHVDDITRELIKIRRANGGKVPKNIAASVRNGLQRYCSASLQWDKRNDLFRPVGNGFWKLKPKEKAMTVPAKTTTPAAGEIMESVIIKGDLGKLTPEERTRYYNEVCRSIGLNPLTQPLQYLTLSGRLTLYARRDAADQLRKINGISLEIVSEDMADGLLTIHVRAKDRDGRQDEDLGVVSLPETMKGEARANQILKAVTKAKRRVTLSISGLGFLDETEVEDIPAASKRPVAAPNVMQQHAHPFNPEVLKHDPQTGEITQSAMADEDTPPADAAPSATSTGGAAQLPIEDMARNAARHGEDVFRTFYRNRTGPEQARVNAIGDELREIMDAVPQQE